MWFDYDEIWLGLRMIWLRVNALELCELLIFLFKREGASKEMIVLYFRVLREIRYMYQLLQDPCQQPDANSQVLPCREISAGRHLNANWIWVQVSVFATPFVVPRVNFSRCREYPLDYTKRVCQVVLVCSFFLFVLSLFPLSSFSFYANQHIPNNILERKNSIRD